MNSLKLWVLLIWAVGAVGCAFQAEVPVTVVVLPPTATPTPTATLPPSPTPTATPVPLPWTDANAVMAGVCFEAALAAAGETIVLRSAEDHIRFYNQVDESGLCRRPVGREPFDFAGGARVLAGGWSYGRGCDAAHTVTDYTLTDGGLALSLAFATAGDCDYELLQPFWVAVEGVTDVQIRVSTP